jgi:hypothetical protein
MNTLIYQTMHGNAREKDQREISRGDIVGFRMYGISRHNIVTINRNKKIQ